MYKKVLNVSNLIFFIIVDMLRANDVNYLKKVKYAFYFFHQFNIPRINASARTSDLSVLVGFVGRYIFVSTKELKGRGPSVSSRF